MISNQQWQAYTNEVSFCNDGSFSGSKQHEVLAIFLDYRRMRNSEVSWWRMDSLTIACNVNQMTVAYMEVISDIHLSDLLALLMVGYNGR